MWHALEGISWLEGINANDFRTSITLHESRDLTPWHRVRLHTFLTLYYTRMSIHIFIYVCHICIHICLSYKHKSMFYNKCSFQNILLNEYFLNGYPFSPRAVWILEHCQYLMCHVPFPNQITSLQISVMTCFWPF